jgi:hypothetical protein
VAALRKIRSDIKIIMTGDSDNPAPNTAGGVIDKGFLPKPFTTEKLLTIIHEALAKKTE